MQTFQQFIAEAKIKIKGNLCHEFGKFTPCEGKSEKPKSKKSKVIDDDSVKKSLEEITKNGKYSCDHNTHKFLLENKIDPKELVKSVIGVDMSKDFKGKVYIEKEGDHKIKIVSFDLEHPTGAKIKQCTRTLDLKKGEVHHDLLELEQSSQNSNVVKQMYKDALPMYKKLKMKKITLQANLTAGGYAWAKYGFKPSKGTDNEDGFDNDINISNVHKNSASRLNTFTDYVPLSGKAKQEHDGILKLIEKTKPDKIISVLANLKTPNLDKELNNHKDKISAFTGVKTFPPKFEMTASKFLLINSNWFGELELKGKSKKHLEQYINQ